MENRKVGYLLLGLSVIMVVIVILFNIGLQEIVNASCSLAGHESCEMEQTIARQTYISLSIIGIIVLVGFLLIFSKPEKELVIKRILEKAKKKVFDTSDLSADEKKVFVLIRDARTIFQAELIEKSGMGKVGMTRLLDRLESKGFIERKRRGMTNIVALKE
ncbi:MAG TPA: MarR family transcriptional regulator [Candidatus Nanoarchaeia archaeon]|nr:MarR family transcriptional regulator [Candidatus Nanoarchaeia archaeon]